MQCFTFFLYYFLYVYLSLYFLLFFSYFFRFGLSSVVFLFYFSGLELIYFLFFSPSSFPTLFPFLVSAAFYLFISLFLIPASHFTPVVTLYCFFISNFLLCLLFIFHFTFISFYFVLYVCTFIFAMLLMPNVVQYQLCRK